MRKIGIAATLVSAILLGGCAGLRAPEKLPGAAPSGQSASVQPQYESDMLKQQLVDMGLLQPFTRYWASYAARDWGQRYRMEEFQKPQEEQFYVSYHAAAWQLLEMRVEAIDASAAPERVRISLRARFRNPERPGQERDTFLQDLWAQRDKGWVHVNSDPMLNGLRGVK